MPNPSQLTAAAYRPDQILLQLKPGSSGAEHSHALEAIGGRLIEIIKGGDVAGSDLARVGLGHGVTVEKAIQILSHLPGVKFAEPDYLVSAQAVSNDAGVVSGQTWGLYGDVGSPTNLYGSQASEAWAAGHTGSTKVAVGVVDSGMDYTHPDLHLNVWLNQREIPLSFKAALVDADADGLITFRDLNDARNANFVSDKNANSRIDAGDLLNDARWENGLDDDANGYRDDLIGWDFVNNDNDPMDDQGHGTHVSGTIGATGGNGIGVAGVNWSTQMVALKFLDATNYGYTSNTIKALDYFTAASKVGTGIDFAATNNSWGGAPYSQALLDAITRGANQDIVYVAAAGNNGANNDATPFWPSNYSTLATAGYDAVVSVAAIGNTGALASWSNYGTTSVDIAAPGVGIYSTTLGGGYGAMNGTSMAAPHVAGAIALFTAAHSGATAAQIRAALMSSSTATSSVLDRVASDGRLDISKFIDTVVTAPAPAPPPPPPPPPPPSPAPTTGVLITGTAGADVITPSTGATSQMLPTIYADTLVGLAGHDTLNGGAGADSLVGGAGDDTYIVDAAGDAIQEVAGEGTDLVQSGVSHTLSANVENLTLTGAANINATGNDLANILVGNGGSNFIFAAAGNDKLDGAGGADTLQGGLGLDTLTGGSGDDRLHGGAGSDLYIGGAGKDVYVFERGQVAGDAIQDFAKGDKIQLDGYSAGSSITKVAGSSTDWKVTDGATGASELLKLLNGHNLRGGDFLFG